MKLKTFVFQRQCSKILNQATDWEKRLQNIYSSELKFKKKHLKLTNKNKPIKIENLSRLFTKEICKWKRNENMFNIIISH